MGSSATRSRVFFRVVLPALVLVNLALGLFNLSLIAPRTGIGYGVMAGAAFTLVLAGWLAGAWWSRLYWRSVMQRQVQTWRQVVDAVFGWIEELPVTPDHLRRLKTSIERTIPN